MSQFSNQQKADEAIRELGLRQYVYRNRVAAGKMTVAKANELIALMEEIAADYRNLAMREREEKGLFAGLD